MATDQDAIRNAYRLALSIDESGGGSAMNDEVMAILASQLSEGTKIDVIREVQDEFAQPVSYFSESATAAPPAHVESYTRRRMRTQFWYYVAALFFAFAVALPIVRCTASRDATVREPPISGVATGAAAARGAAAAAIR
jgi:hypothetical protein